MPTTRNVRSTRQAGQVVQPIHTARQNSASATPPSPTSTLSLIGPIHSPTTSPASSPEPCQRRAKRVRSSIGRKSPDHIRRPRNAFILFRSHMYKTLKSDAVQLPGTKHQNQQNELSKMAAAAWKTMGDNEREPFQAIAHAEKTAHKIMYPDYVYAPSGKSGSGKSKAPKKASTPRRKKLASPPPPPPPPPPPVHYDFPFHHPPRRAAAQRASEIISQMDVLTPPSSVCSASGSDIQMDVDEDFIPTSEIPPLDLNATVQIKEELQYPTIENYLEGYISNGHYTSDGNFSTSVMQSSSPYIDLQADLSFSHPPIPNSLLPIFPHFDNGQTLEVDTYPFSPDVFDVSTSYSEFPLLAADYQANQPQWGADATVTMFGVQQDWAEYVNYNQFSS